LIPGPRHGARPGAMRDSAEFRRIRALIDSVAAPCSEPLLGPGDDAAIVESPGRQCLVVSTDLSVERVHFRREWLTWNAIGFRATAAAISDLAAMAARPIGVLVSLAVPPEADARTLDELASGIGECLRENGACLLGGDLSQSPGPVFIDVTVIGSADVPVRRSGARPGDELWVTGRLGGAALAAASWAAGLEPDPRARRAFERPPSRTGAARMLCETADVHALIDLSDGLAGDAEQMAAASGVRLVVESARVPLHPALEDWAQPEVALGMAVGGGEDYELLAAMPPGMAGVAAAELAREYGLDLSCVGRVEAGEGVEWHDARGEIISRPAGGFDHFDVES